MGMPAHLIGATLRLAVAQRLVRKLCAHCRQPVPLPAAQALALGIPAASGQSVYEAEGCLYCAGRGYSGRMGLFECAVLDSDLAGLISKAPSEPELIAALRQKGFHSLLQDGAAKVLSGQTTVKEVLNAVTEY